MSRGPDLATTARALEILGGSARETAAHIRAILDPCEVALLALERFGLVARLTPAGRYRKRELGRLALQARTRASGRYSGRRRPGGKTLPLDRRAC